MLVLVSFGLVLLATILLVVGLLTDDGLNLIYLSIACSAVAAVVLYFAFRRAKPKSEVAARPPEPILPEGAEDDEPALAATVPTSASDATAVQPVVPAPQSDPADAVNPGGTPTADTERAVATDEPEDDVDVVPATNDDDSVSDGWVSDDWVSDDDWADAGDFEVEFPIADYDALSVDEIMPLLPQLYSDELEIVAERERTTKNRPEVLARLDELAATGTDADALDGADLDGADLDGADLDGADEDRLDGSVDPGGTPTADMPTAMGAEPVAAGGSARPVPEVPSLADDEWAEGDVPFPIADFDILDADQVITLLAQLEEDELEDVKAREVAGAGRKSVLTEIDRLLGVAPDGDDAWRSDVVQPPAVGSETSTGSAAPSEPVATGAPEGRTVPDHVTPGGSILAIGGYDGLTVNQIRPLLAGLSHAELQAVLEHEVARDNRRTIVADIERRLAQPEPVVDTPPAASRPSPSKAAPTKSPASSTKSTAKKAGAKKAAAKKSTAKKATAKKATAKKAAARRFPIDDYDTLGVTQIRPLLASLSNAELEQVRAHEVAGAGRRTVLAEIDRRLR